MDIDPVTLLRDLNSEAGDDIKRFSLRSEARWSEYHPASDEIYRRAPDTFHARLRTLVNEWIATGKRDGIDEPRKRKFTRHSPGYEAVQTWLQRNHPRMSHALTGELFITQSALPIQTRSAANAIDDPIAKMEELAIGKFSSLLQSPLKYYIARCDHRSPHFFFRKKLRASYKGDSFCLECRRAAAAERKTKKDRNDAKEETFELASAAWAKWPSLSTATQSKHGSIELYTIGKIASTGKTMKWITRNRRAIEQRAKELSNAAR
jgi:hypothetical protein